MSDTSDNHVLYDTYTNPIFQDRCRLRFINAAIAVGAEVLPATTNASTAAANNVLHFAAVSSSVIVGMGASDLFASVIPNGTIVSGVTATTVTIDNNVTGNGVASGDIINFAPASHTARLQFAGALFAGSVDLTMLAMTVLANTTNRSNCLAAPTLIGGNIVDNDIDFQVNSVYTGVAISRNW